jgi:hypothetical protein
VRRYVRLLVAGIVALAAVLAVGLLTRVPYSVGDRQLAAVRLSWRMAGHAVEECRTLSAEELEKLPAHMRQPEVCDSYVPPYRLRVLVDGETIEDILVLAGGSRQDNPIYVYSELRVRPGPHELSVAFWQEEDADVLPTADVSVVGGAEGTGQDAAADGTRAVSGAEGAGGTGAAAGAESAGPVDIADTAGAARPSRESAPARLELHETIDLRPHQVALVTYDREARRLVLR